jgi:hypothetical protein
MSKNALPVPGDLPDRNCNLQTERDTVIALRNEEAINDQALHRIERDIDLAEARLHRRT